MNNKNDKKANDLLCINQMIGKNSKQIKRAMEFQRNRRYGGQRLTTNRSKQPKQSSSQTTKQPAGLLKRALTFDSMLLDDATPTYRLFNIIRDRLQQLDTLESIAPT